MRATRFRGLRVPQCFLTSRFELRGFTSKHTAGVGFDRSTQQDVKPNNSVTDNVISIKWSQRNETVFNFRILPSDGTANQLNCLRNCRPSAVYIGLGLLDFFDLSRTYKVNDLMMANCIEPAAKTKRRRYGEFLPLIQTCVLQKTPMLPVGRDQGVMLTSNARSLLRYPWEVITMYKLVISGAEKEYGDEGTLSILERFAPNYYRSWIVEDARCILLNMYNAILSASNHEKQSSTPLNSQVPRNVKQTLWALNDLGVTFDQNDIKWTKKQGSESVHLPVEEMRRCKVSKIDLRRAQMRAAVHDQWNFIQPQFFSQEKSEGSRMYYSKRPVEILLVCRKEIVAELESLVKNELPKLFAQQKPISNFDLARYKKLSNSILALAWFFYGVIPFALVLLLIRQTMVAWNLFFTQGRQVSVGGDELLTSWYEGNANAPVNKYPKYKKISTSFIDINSFYRNDDRE